MAEIKVQRGHHVAVVFGNRTVPATVDEIWTDANNLSPKGQPRLDLTLHGEGDDQNRRMAKVAHQTHLDGRPFWRAMLSPPKPATK